ncbi:MAG: hypothetical protein V5A32_03460 [Halovenus sp.]
MAHQREVFIGEFVKVSLFEIGDDDVNIEIFELYCLEKWTEYLAYCHVAIPGSRLESPDTIKRRDSGSPEHVEQVRPVTPNARDGDELCLVFRESERQQLRAKAIEVHPPFTACRPRGAERCIIRNPDDDLEANLLEVGEFGCPYQVLKREIT